MKEAPKLLQIRTLLFIRSPDAERVSNYNLTLFSLLNKYLDTQKYNGIRPIELAQIYPEVKFEKGEAIDLTTNIIRYSNSRDFNLSPLIN